MAGKIGLGARVQHPTFGEGVVYGGDMHTLKIFFGANGNKELDRDFEGLELLEAAEGIDEALSLDDVRDCMIDVLQRFADFTMLIALGDKWKGGNMVLQPADKSLASKEIPIETFFHKIVMVRDRLRVLEQNINSHGSLSDEEKVNLQQYITRVYGSLTTFNVLFARKEDYFKGESSKG